MTHREQLDAVLRHAVILGTLAILFIPAARGGSEWFGWLPLWLVGMPVAAWWALHRFRVPTVLRRVRPAAARRRAPQARRLRTRGTGPARAA